MCVRLNQLCNSGPVAERAKNGSPTVAPSTSTIQSTGSSSPCGFQVEFGTIGSKAHAANRMHACTIACIRGVRRLLVRCA